MKFLYSIITCTIVLLGGLSASAEPPIRHGDRIAIVGNTFADQLRTHGYLETLLLLYTRGDAVSIRNLGWGGDTLTTRARPTNFPTEESTLTAHRTDVIIACFGMGESFDADGGPKGFKSDLEKFINSHAGKKYNGESEVRLILVSPIACEDLGKLTPGRDRINRDLEAYTGAMKEVAVAAKIPFIDLFNDSRQLMDESPGIKLTNNGIHLNPYGYWAMSRSFFTQLVADETSDAPQPWRIRMNLNAEAVEASGLGISDLDINDSSISFLVTEESAPSLAPPTDRPLPAQLEKRRDSLVVENLKPGTYQLTVDGNIVASGTHSAWAQGVPIDDSPAHKSAENYRAVVNDKNLQFTYSWKALNQVHIVGERRRSPSGRALHGEIIEFNNITNQLDETLGKGIELRTRQWRLSRVSE